MGSIMMRVGKPSSIMIRNYLNCLLHGDPSGWLSGRPFWNKRQAFREAFHFLRMPRKLLRWRMRIWMVCWTMPISSVTRWKFMQLANAQAFLAVQKQFGSLMTISGPVDQTWTIKLRITRKPIELRNYVRAGKSKASNLSVQFCVYSFLEAAGLINDHENNCDWK